MIRRGGCSLSKDRGKLRKGRKVKIPRNPHSLLRTEHKDTQGQREETGTVPQREGHGGSSKDGALTQDNMSLVRERKRRGAGREGWLVQGSKHRSWLPSHLCLGVVIPGITLSPLMPP